MFIICIIISTIFSIAILIIVITNLKERNTQEEKIEPFNTVEDEKLIKSKKEMFERQKNMRKKNAESEDDIMNNNNLIIENKEKIEEKKQDIKINTVLEDMCIYGNIMKKEIQKEKEENPEKFIEIKDALKLEQENQDLFALGLLSQNLEDEGIETVIEKENNEEDEQDAGITCLQFITSGLYNKKKYDLHFDLSEERAEEI